MSAVAFNSRHTHFADKAARRRLPAVASHNSIAALLPWLSAALGRRRNTTKPSVNPTVRAAGASQSARQGPIPAELRGTPARTTGFEQHLHGRVLLIADGENLSYGLRKRGHDCDYGLLRKAFASGNHNLSAHAFACVFGDDAGKYAQEYFRREGWQPHIGLARTVQTYQGPQVKANSDNQILLACGELINATRPDTLVLATGDGDLGEAIVEFYATRLKHGSVVVVSTVDAISRRLRKEVNPYVTANVLVGFDCIVPVR